MSRTALLTLSLLAPSIVSAAGPPPGPPEVYIDYPAARVVRRGTAGREAWSAKLGGRVGYTHRDPDLVWDDGRVYVAHADGVVALDSMTGAVLWRSKGPQHRLFLDGPLLLAAECSSGLDVKEGRALVARSTLDGEAVFRVPLPLKDFDPLPIRKIAGLYLVQSGRSVDGEGAALLFDRRGVVKHRLGRPVIDGLGVGADIVLLTEGEVVRLGPDGRRRWGARMGRGMSAGGLIALEGGHALAHQHCPTSDSGVRAARIDLTTGKAVWRAECAALGVDHSKYRHHAWVDIRGGQARVTSLGSSGMFTETLGLKSGARLSRAAGPHWLRAADESLRPDP